MYIDCVPYSEAKKTDYDEKLFKMQIHQFRIAPVPSENTHTHIYEYGTNCTRAFSPVFILIMSLPNPSLIEVTYLFCINLEYIS